MLFDSLNAVAALLDRQGYVSDPALSTSLFLALKLGRPLFLEGAPGVGKTELARVLAEVFETELIRLQCYEGLDLQQAAYEWDYPRQLLALQAHSLRPARQTPAAEGGVSDDSAAAGRGALGDIFNEAFLLRRPLLRAIDAARDKAPVLLIDELDRADEEFESFLLELLSEFQITIPELGTLRARFTPIVLLTSNRTREIHDALKRRCIYHYIDYPSFEKEHAILARKVPSLAPQLQRQIVAFVQRIRQLDLSKLPGMSETLDWARALEILGATQLEAALVDQTLGFFLKYQDDIERVRGPVAAELIRAAQES